jgi:ribosome-binding protein aMBF1 (putative translation factor)
MAELEADIAAYRNALENQGEYFPMEFGVKLTEAYHAGESLIPLYREYRGLSQESLADAAHIKQLYLSDIESGKKTASVKELSAIAVALSISLDDLI